MKKTVFLLVLALLVATSLLAFTACGNDSDTYADDPGSYGNDPAVSETEDDSAPSRSGGKGKKVKGKAELNPVNKNDLFLYGRENLPEKMLLVKWCYAGETIYIYSINQFLSENDPWYLNINLQEENAESIEIKFDGKNYVECTYRDSSVDSKIETSKQFYKEENENSPWDYFAWGLSYEPANAHYTFHVDKNLYYEIIL